MVSGQATATPWSVRYVYRAEGLPGRYGAADLARLLGVSVKYLGEARRVGRRVRGRLITSAGTRPAYRRSVPVDPCTGRRYPPGRRWLVVASGLPGEHHPADLARRLGVTRDHIINAMRLGCRVRGHSVRPGTPRPAGPAWNRLPRVNPRTGLAWSVPTRSDFPLLWATNSGASGPGGTWCKWVGGRRRSFGSCAVEAERRYLAWLAERGLHHQPRPCPRTAPRRRWSLDSPGRGPAGRGATLAETLPDRRRPDAVAAVAASDAVDWIAANLPADDAAAVRRFVANEADLPPDVAERIILRFGHARLFELLAAD